MIVAFAIFLFLDFMIIITSLRVVPQGQIFLVERLGRYHKSLKPGIHFLIPMVERVAYRLKEVEEAVEIPDFNARTQDEVEVVVSLELKIKLTDPSKACYQVADYRQAVQQLTQQVVAKKIAQHSYERLKENRTELAKQLTNELSEAISQWGIAVVEFSLGEVNRNMSNRFSS